MVGNEKLASQKKLAAGDCLPSDAVCLIVNGENVETRSRTLDILLEELGYGGRRVATARNGEFVPERARSGTALFPDDTIEVVSPRQGG